MVDLARLRAPLRRLPPVAADAALAGVVAVVTLTSVVVTDRNDPGVQLTVGGVALLVVQFVALVWRRRAPLTVAVVVIAAGMWYGIAKLPDPAVGFAPAVAIYTVAAWRTRRVGIAAAAVAAGLGTLALLFSRDSDIADVAVNYAGGITAWAVGETVRNQRDEAAAAEARRAEDARRAVADERVRIARDLHDVVAHHLSVIVVQAEAAQEVLAADPDRAESAMGTVADTARGALGELRRVLGVLRSDPGDRAPQPDLASVDDLVAAVRQAGLAVDVRTEGRERPVAAVVGLTAYRVVQEALTNVLRHAAARRAEVALAFETDALVVTVSDDGRGAATGAGANAVGNGAGHGLAGMRERVATLGGSLDAGPRGGGGFAVRARLPLAP
jgi:signal transduction histidine kinase